MNDLGDTRGSRALRCLKRFIIPACAAVIWTLALVLAFRCMHNHLPFFGLYQDDAIYVVTAKSLAQGDGYKILSLPGSPLQTKYPIMFPLLLAAVWHINPHFPENLAAIETLSLLLAISFVTVCTLYLIKTHRVTPALGVALGGATILNIRFLSVAPMPMSDFLFGLFCVLSLWLTEGVASRPYDQWTSRQFGLLICNATAALSRTAGALLIPLTAWHLWRFRKPRAAALQVLGAVLLLGPYWLWCHDHQQVQNAFATFYTSYSQWTLQTYHDIGAPLVVAHKLGDLFTSFLPLAWPFLGAIPYHRLDPVSFFLVYRLGYLVLWLLLFCGIALELSNRQRALLGAWVSLYLLGLVVWPGFTEWRHLLVILPFVYYLYVRAFRWIALRAKRVVSNPHHLFYTESCKLASLAFGVYLVLGASLPSIFHAGNYPNRLLHRPDLNADIEQQDTVSTYRWIKQNTADSAVFVCNNDALLYLYTCRTAVTPSAYEGWRSHSLNLVSPESLVQAMKQYGADYLIVDPSYGAAYAVYDQLVKSLSELSDKHHGLFAPAYKSPHNAIFVFKVNKEQLRDFTATAG